MNRTLRRPMFRMGGSTGEGITSGLETPRQNYQKAGDVEQNDLSKVDLRSMDMQQLKDLAGSMSYSPRGTNINDFLISTGLNLVSNPSQGNIFQDIAGSSKEPYKEFMKGKQSAEEQRYASESDMFKTLIAAKADMAGGTGGKTYAKLEIAEDIEKTMGEILKLETRIQDGEEGLIEYEKLTTLFNQVTLKPGTLKVSEETLLLLNQFFVTLTDINIARGFEEALDEAVDAYATANDIEAVATYNKESTYPDPENPDERLLYHRNNLTDFQDIIDEITQRKAAYYRGIALDAKAISESLQDDGIITTDFDFSALDEIDERDEDEVDEVDEVTLEVDTDAFKTYYQQIKQQHDEGIITDEDWEYFRENGELPPKP